MCIRDRYKPQPQWIMMREDREKALAKRYVTNMEKLTAGTKELTKLEVGDSVLVQNQVGNHPSKWDITGIIVETRDHDQYVVKVDGSGRMTLRNRKFLKKIKPYSMTKHFKTVDNPVPTNETRPTSTDTPSVSHDPVTTALEQPRVITPDPEPVVVADTPSPTPPPSTTPPPELRRSSRVSKAPEKLQVGWGTKSYADVVRTDHCSLGNTVHLHHKDPGGGGDINESVQIS